MVGVAPELSTVPAGAQTAVLAYVNSKLKVSVFDGEAGPMTFLARAYLAAHYGAITLMGASGATGPVTQESAGGLSRMYAGWPPIGSDPVFDVTPYGKQFRGLCSMSSARGPMVL